MTFFHEVFDTGGYVVYAVSGGPTAARKLARVFPAAVRVTRARALELARAPGREGGWCVDGKSDLERAARAGGDQDVTEAAAATERAVDAHAAYLREEAEWEQARARAAGRAARSARAAAGHAGRKPG